MLQMQIMKMRKKVLKTKHFFTLNSMFKLASMHNNQERRKEVEELQIQAMKTDARVLKTEHPFILIRMSNLALTYKNQER